MYDNGEEEKRKCEQRKNVKIKEKTQNSTVTQCMTLVMQPFLIYPLLTGNSYIIVTGITFYVIPSYTCPP